VRKKMKKLIIIALLTVLSVFICSCGEGEDNGEENNTGVLQFKMTNSVKSSETIALKAVTNPKLTGESTAVYTTSMKLVIGDVWVSQDEVKAGGTDDLEWVRLTTVTNTEPKLFEDYSFSDIEIPAGTYKSIKISLGNVFYRYAELISDPSVKYELLETMGSWEDACDENDKSWADTNYFGPDGNHVLKGDVFEMVTEGEKIGGFTIEPDKTAVVSWRLGAGVTTPCTTYLIDENANLEWDCGVDSMEFDCPPEVKYMWDFVVEYQ
jgi:hypothetical protein